MPVVQSNSVLDRLGSLDKPLAGQPPLSASFGQGAAHHSEMATAGN
jgi:hypothetical protein